MEYFQRYATKKDITYIDEIRKLHYADNALVPLQLYISLIERQPYSTTLLQLSEKIIGYFSLLAINNVIHEKLLSKQIFEKDLCDCLPLLPTESDYRGMNIYILSVAGLDKHESEHNKLLFYRLIKRLKYLKQEYSIESILSDVLNDKIRKLIYNQVHLRDKIKIMP